MSRIVILDAETLGDDTDLSPVLSLGDCAVFPSTGPGEAADHIGESEVVLVNKVKLTRDILSKCPCVRMIGTFATGYDVVDLDYCKEAGIALCNVRGYSTESVLDLTMAMALQLTLHLKSYQDYVNDGSYSVSGVANHLTPSFHDLSGKTWGIIGYGSIGRRVGEVARALGCTVIYTNRTGGDPGKGYRTLDELIVQSDIVSLHLPLNQGTRHLISKARIEKMKDGAILINVARGLICDEQALTDAVLSGKLGGLGVDVYSEEPFSKNHPFSRLLNHPNVLLTPHMAWGSIEARNRCVREVRENIVSFFAGGSRNRIM